MNRNEQPQMAPSRVNSNGVRQSRSAACGTAFMPCLRPSSVPRQGTQDRAKTPAAQARSIAASHKYGLRLDMQLRPSLLPALAVFAVAARHQNFAQAAQELHLTASAVSHHVRRLEEVLETRLFLRHARGVRLTAEGRQLADAASAAFTDVAAVAHHLHPAADSVPLRITTLRSLPTRTSASSCIPAAGWIATTTTARKSASVMGWASGPACARST
ncbi:hypothetical protein G6F65_017302 [Rhizopus arrhizus]|nr:hypothetical protein G6F65_017302 [Rhizopus arrhizus]